MSSSRSRRSRSERSSSSRRERTEDSSEDMDKGRVNGAAVPVWMDGMNDNDYDGAIASGCDDCCSRWLELDRTYYTKGFMCCLRHSGQ